MALGHFFLLKKPQRTVIAGVMAFIGIHMFTWKSILSHCVLTTMIFNYEIDCSDSELFFSPLWRKRDLKKTALLEDIMTVISRFFLQSSSEIFLAASVGL